MIDTRDADRAFTALANTLREHDMSWVVAQVDEKLSLGKVTTRKLAPRERQREGPTALYATEPMGKAARADALFAVADEYTPVERLQILLDSITIAIPTANSVAEAALSLIGGLGGAAELDFVSEVETGLSFSLSIETLTPSHRGTVRLLGLIAELKRELTDAD